MKRYRQLLAAHEVFEPALKLSKKRCALLFDEPLLTGRDRSADLLDERLELLNLKEDAVDGVGESREVRLLRLGDCADCLLNGLQTHGNFREVDFLGDAVYLALKGSYGAKERLGWKFRRVRGLG